MDVELFFMAQNIRSMKEKKNYYREQTQHQKIIFVPIRTVFHQCLDVIAVKDTQDIPNIFQYKA